MLAGYLLTDIEASTARWERWPGQMREAMARHNAIVGASIAGHGGRIVDSAGDGVFALFEAGDPLTCALAIQSAIAGQDWSDVNGLWVRVGVHAGPVDANGEPDRASVHRAARITQSASGGQILISDVAHTQFGTPAGAIVRDLGAHILRDLITPMRLYALGADPASERQWKQPIGRPGPGLVGASDAPTAFGRETEIETLLKGLGRGERVTIIAPGGAGKTRIARVVAARLAKKRVVYWLDVAQARSSEALGRAICEAVGLSTTNVEDAWSEFSDFARDRALVLVLDNGEGLCDEERRLSGLLEQCPQLSVLGASRAPLGLPGEHLFRLRGLSCANETPDAVRRSPAFAFFLPEARRFDPDFELGEAEAPVFARVSNRLGGSPLALGLLARWLRVSSLPALEVRLASSGVSFLDDARARDQSPPIGEVIEATWHMLRPQARDLLAGLSVFAGPFEAAAVREIVGSAAGEMLELQELGLVETTGDGRFCLHALIGEFAAAQLKLQGARADELARAHASYFLSRACAEAHEADVHGADVRRAWLYTATDAGEDLARQFIEPLFYRLIGAARFAEGVTYFKSSAAGLRTHARALHAACVAFCGRWDEGERASKALLTSPECTDIIRGHLHQTLGNVAHMRGDHDKAFAHYKIALSERAHDYAGLAYTRLAMAALHLQRGETEPARVLVRTVYEAVKPNDHALLMETHVFAGDVALADEKFDRARANFEESLRHEAFVNNMKARAIYTWRLATVLQKQGHHEAARGRHLEAVALAEALKEDRLAIGMRLGLARDCCALEEWPAARDVLTLVFRSALAIRARPMLAQALIELARLENQLGNTREARRLAGALANVDLGRYQSDYALLLTQIDDAEEGEIVGHDLDQAVRELVRTAELARWGLQGFSSRRPIAS